MLDDIEYEQTDLTALDNSEITGGGSTSALTDDEIAAVSGYGLIEGAAKRGSAQKRIVSLEELSHAKFGGASTYRMATQAHVVDSTIRKIMPEKITKHISINNTIHLGRYFNLLM
jgi:hypothetical protein